MAEFHTTTSEWSDNIETSLKTIREKCQGYTWINMLSSKRATLKYNILMYTMLFMGPVSGVLSSMVAYDINPSHALDILVIIISFLSGIISAIIKFAKFDQKATSHKSLATKYASLESNITRQLILNRDDRVNAGEYLEWVCKSYDSLFALTPIVSEELFKEWKTKNKEVVININPSASDNLDLATFSDGNMKYQLTRLNAKI